MMEPRINSTYGFLGVWSVAIWLPVGLLIASCPVLLICRAHGAFSIADGSLAMVLLGR
jgi:hypothetical protein